jgi:hypothetical protein
MKRLVIHSRSSIESADLTAGDPCAAICIAYPTGRLHRVVPMGNLLRVHHSRFSDCDGNGVWTFPENKDHSLPVPMTRGQALDIIEFVAVLPPEVTTLHVACYGGVSRSRGVAAGLADVYGWDDSEVHAKGQPNAWCRSLILSVARERGL